jgi:hypothetical protein
VQQLIGDTDDERQHHGHDRTSLDADHECEREHKHRRILRHRNNPDSGPLAGR